MARLVLTEADGHERKFVIPEGGLLIGRQRDAGVVLEGNEVSRRHSRVWLEGERFLLEDLGSSNGTFVNGAKVRGKTELRAFDQIRVGPHLLRFESGAAIPPAERLTILGRTEADTSNSGIFRENPAAKLKAMLELSHVLASAFDLEEVFRRLLDFLFVLFPKADNGVVVLAEGEQLVLRSHKIRHPPAPAGPAFSRSVVKAAIREGHGILGEDVQSDTRFREAATLISLGSRSFICAPLALRGGKVLGAIQLDRLGSGRPFAQEDLNLLTAIGLQVAAVVENAQLHEELVRKERLERDLVMARQIQESFLPQDKPRISDGGVELFARVYPALEVSGDFYDYFLDDGGWLTFAIADVCGKGMPAALFMTMCLTLLRNLAPGMTSPAAILQKLNLALTRDNPGMMYVTMVLGKFSPQEGDLVLACGGHPAGIIKRSSGVVENINITTGSLLGCGELPKPIADTDLILAPGDTLVLYTDGVTEAIGGKDSGEMFGGQRFAQVLADLRPDLPLEDWAQQIHSAVTHFGHGRPLGDDLTLLMLRNGSVRV